GGDHREADALLAAALDPPRRALADRVGVEAERHHHLRVMGGAAPAVVAIGAIEALEVELLDRVQDEPGEMMGGEPLAQVRRHQELLVTLAREEVWAHSWMLGPGPDGGLCDTLRPKRLFRQPGGFEGAASSDRLLDLALGGGVVALAALAEVLATAALERVLALLAEQGVLALAALEEVFPGSAADHVVPSNAGERVVPAQAGDHVLAER